MDARHIDTTRKLIGLYLPTLAISIGQGLILPAVPALALHFGVSPGLAAQIVTAFAAGRLAALIPSGMLVDRIGPGRVLLLGSTSLVAGALLIAVTPVFWGLLIGQCLAGAGSSLWTAGREISGLNLVRADQRGRLLSGFFGLQLAGTALGPVAGGVITDTAGLRVLFAANLLVGLAVLVLTAVIERVAPSPAPAPLQPLPPGRLHAIAPDHRRTFLILIFATFCMTMYRMSLNSLLPIYAGVTRGLSSTQVGALFGISSLGIFLMIIPAGLLLDRVGRKWGAVPAAAIPAVAFAVMPFAHTLPQLSVMAAVLGVANGLSLGSMSTFSYDVIPEFARGRLQALRRVVGDSGAFAGALAAGLIADRYGAGPAFFFYVPLLLAAALLLAFGTRETLARKRPGAAPADRIV